MSSIPMSTTLNKIFKISLPTGFPIGDVNVYVIKDDPVTLIDTGINGAISEHIFSRNLGYTGLKFEDIKRIIITHTHLDHCGMAGRLQELSNAEIFVFDLSVPEITNFNESFLKKPKILKNFYMESAVPESFLTRSIRTYQKSAYLCSNVKNASPLSDGSEISSENFNFHVIHTPGHSDDMICLYEKEMRILFSSDHITLHTIPSLRLREVFREKNGDLGNMYDYFESLEKIEKLDISLTFPGHSEFFADPTNVIKRIKEIYFDRKELVAKILKRGRLNRFELTRALFGFLNDREIFKGIPEITGHLELLEREGRLTKWTENGIVYYSARH